jgi:hypothetical protein
MLELSPPLLILLLPRVGGLSALSTRAIEAIRPDAAETGTWAARALTACLAQSLYLRWQPQFRLRVSLQ